MQTSPEPCCCHGLRHQLIENYSRNKAKGLSCHIILSGKHGGSPQKLYPTESQKLHRSMLFSVE